MTGELTVIARHAIHPQKTKGATHKNASTGFLLTPKQMLYNPPFALQPMQRIFNRESDHPWETAIQEMLKADVIFRAFARNLEWDPHVSVGREDAALKCVESLPSESVGADVWSRLNNGLRDYFETRVRGTLVPDFTLPENSENIIKFATADHAGVHAGLDLVRVLDLSGLDLIYAWAQKDRRGRYPFLTHYVLDKDLPSLLDDGLQIAEENPKSPEEQGEFLRQLFEVVNDYRKGIDLETGGLIAPRPFHPCWVSLWGSLNPEEPPERWLELVGVAKPVGRWLALMRYNQEDGIRLVRPTVLDSAPSGYFFPSPQSSFDHGGGACLDFDVKFGKLTPEFIHVQQDLGYEAWIAGGGKCRKTRRAVDCDLAAVRASHRRKLPADVDDAEWMIETT